MLMLPNILSDLLVSLLAPKTEKLSLLVAPNPFQNEKTPCCGSMISSKTSKNAFKSNPVSASELREAEDRTYPHSPLQRYRRKSHQIPHYPGSLPKPPQSSLDPITNPAIFPLISAHRAIYRHLDYACVGGLGDELR
jgi:hypothetical protein